MSKYVYDFAEGSREMRDLLGGKGANVAEMTRILGAGRVPAGFTITTEACVAYMAAGRTQPDGLADEVAAALARLEERTRQAAGRRRRPAARLGPLGGARVDAGDARHRPQPRPQRPCRSRGWPGRRATTASPGTPTGASSRCSPTSSAGSPGSAFEAEIAAIKRERGVTARHRARRRRPAGADRPLQGAVPRAARATTSRRSPATSSSRRSAPSSTRGSATGRSTYRRHQRHPRRLGHGRQRPADGLRQQGRDVGLGRRLQPRRADRRARALRRLPHQRPGRGRRLGRAQHRATSPSWREVMPDAHAELIEILRTPRAPLRRHAGHRVHRRGGAPLHAPDAQRQAPGPGGRALRRRRGRRRGCSTGRRRWRRSTPPASTPCCTRPSTRPPRSTSSPGGSPPRRARPRARSCSPRRRPSRAAEAGRDVILVRPFTEAEDVARLPRGPGDPHQRGRQGVARGARRPRAWGARACAGAQALEIDLERGGAAGRRPDDRPGRPDRDRRDDGRDHDRRRAADRARASTSTS